MLLQALLNRFEFRIAGNSATIDRLHFSLLSVASHRVIVSYCLADVIINSSGVPFSRWPLADGSMRACCHTGCFAVHNRLSVLSSKSLVWNSRNGSDVGRSMADRWYWFVFRSAPSDGRFETFTFRCIDFVDVTGDGGGTIGTDWQQNPSASKSNVLYSLSEPLLLVSPSSLCLTNIVSSSK